MPNRISIPRILKNLVWDTCIGRVNGIGNCYVCDQEIDSKTFECGHIISVANGGKNLLNNLKPVCGTCNKSMGTQNLEEFRSIYFPQQKNNKSTTVNTQSLTTQERSSRNITLRDPYQCTRCGYSTRRKDDMRKHFYSTKQICPIIVNNIDLTEEIKRYILVNRVYRPEHHMPNAS